MTTHLLLIPKNCIPSGIFIVFCVIFAEIMSEKHENNANFHKNNENSQIFKPNGSL